MHEAQPFSAQSRFFAHHQGEDGSLVCTHCGLVIHIRRTRLSDYQEQLDAINASLGDFTAKVTDRVKKASQRLGATVEEPAQGSEGGDHEAGKKGDGGHRHGPDCGCTH